MCEKSSEQVFGPSLRSKSSAQVIGREGCEYKLARARRSLDGPPLLPLYHVRLQ